MTIHNYIFKHKFKLKLLTKTYLIKATRKLHSIANQMNRHFCTGLLLNKIV